MKHTRKIWILLVTLALIAVMAPAMVFADGPDWNLSETAVTNIFEYGEYEVSYVEIEGNGEYSDIFNNENSLKSSNTAVATAEWDVIGGDIRILPKNKIGTATITVTDDFGNAKSFTVTNKAPVFKFANDTKSKLYKGYGAEIYRLSDESTSRIKSYSIDNPKVVKYNSESSSYDGSYYDFIYLDPVGLGTATLTVTDELGQKISVKISVGPDLEQSYFGSTNAESPGSYSSEAVYGDTKLDCRCNVNGTTVTYTAGGKTYKGTIAKGKCTLTVPRITRSKISVTFTNGISKYVSEATVAKKRASCVKATAASVIYTGKPLAAKVTVKDGTYTMVKGTDYTVAYKNNVKVGVGTVTISMKGHYTGRITKSFYVRPKGTRIASLTAAKRAFTVKWVRSGAVNGYDVEYSNRKDFKNVAAGKTAYADTIRYTRNTVGSRDFDGLVSGRTYYVRVRTYKRVGGRYIYSLWSPVQRVTVK